MTPLTRRWRARSAFAVLPFFRFAFASQAFHVTGSGNRFSGCYIDGGRAVSFPCQGTHKRERMLYALQSKGARKGEHLARPHPLAGLCTKLLVLGVLVVCVFASLVGMARGAASGQARAAVVMSCAWRDGPCAPRR